MRLLSAIFLLLISSSALGQKNALFTNAKPIDEFRYEGIQGSPYQFESWVKAIIYTNENDPISVDEFNINGYSKELEIRKGNRYIDLIQTGYSRIEVDFEDGSQTIFVRDFEGFFDLHFVELVHDGPKVTCLRKLVVPMIDIEMQNVGKTEKIKRFNPKFLYYFIKDGQLEEVKIKEKKLVEYLGQKKALGSIMNKAKFKTDKLGHLKEILKYYESL